jgi:CRISPR-associated endonuclease/helicase Cas3
LPGRFSAQFSVVKNMLAKFAHSIPGRPSEDWELLAHHLANVGTRAATFAAPFGFQHAALAAGLLHDIGKASQSYQEYIAAPIDPNKRGPDHSTAGAREARERYGKGLGNLLAFAVAGHHAGLTNGADLKRRLDPARYVIEPHDGWGDHVSALPTLNSLATAPTLSKSNEAGFMASFLTRMLFSCLVDADFLETEQFYAQARGLPVNRGGFTPIAVLRERISAFMLKISSCAPKTPVNRARS